jgi:hypothetical protein
MFEIGIFCIIALAIGYWMALWLMGRHDDVLHGDFVEAEPRPETAPPNSVGIADRRRSGVAIAAGRDQARLEGRRPDLKTPRWG